MNFRGSFVQQNDVVEGKRFPDTDVDKRGSKQTPVVITVSVILNFIVNRRRGNKTKDGDSLASRQITAGVWKWMNGKMCLWV